MEFLYTSSFALSPLLKTPKRVGFRAVILAPTRELAQQVGLERGSEGWVGHSDGRGPCLSSRRTLKIPCGIRMLIQVSSV